jgi:biopolymer transport protein ExbB
VNVGEIFQKGGPVILLLLLLSILALSVIIERLWFWWGVLTKEREVVSRVLDAARRDWIAATEIARQAYDQPIGRFLYSPLQLKNPDPETFRLALEASAEDELAAMRRGDKILEAVIALAPLLGLLGTVIGLIITLQSIRLGDTDNSSTAGVAQGIGEALINTGGGLAVAIFSLAFYRLFQGFLFYQAKVFRKSGNDLELLYRQSWSHHDGTSPLKGGDPISPSIVETPEQPSRGSEY